MPWYSKILNTLFGWFPIISTGHSDSPFLAPFPRPMPVMSGDAFGPSSSQQNGSLPKHVSERWWYERKDEIVCSGYKLRPASGYTPDWPPSWLKWGRHSLALDDQPSNEVSTVLHILVFLLKIGKSRPYG
jgi:hypothetical protein